MIVPDWLEENQWLLTLFEPWLTDKTKKGDVLVAFRYGKMTRTEEREVRDSNNLPTRANGLTCCPDCAGPLRERDYSNILDCEKCGPRPRRVVEQLLAQRLKGC